MIDFPASPFDGQVFSATNGVVYKWSATYTSWLAQSAPPVLGGTGQVTTQLASASMPATGADVQVTFPTVIAGNAGLWWSTSTNRYTPPAGSYFISALVSMQSPGSSGSTTFLKLRKNGVAINSWNTSQGAVSSFYTPQVSEYVDANGTDYFDVAVNSNVAAVLQGALFSAFPLTGIQGPTGGAPGAVVGDFMAAHSTFMTLGGTPLVLPFNTVVIGNSGSYYNTANGRWTPPAGRYLLRASGYMYATAAAASSTLQFKKNGVFIDPASAVTSGGGWAAAITAEVLVNANGTDYFEAFGSSSNSAQFYVGTLLATPTQGMVGPPGPAGPVGSIGQMIRGGFTGGSSLPVSAWTTLALNAATTNDTGVAQVGNTWTPPAGRWEVTWSLACTGSAGGVLLAGYSLNGAAPLVYGGGTCISNGADVFVQGSDVIDFNGSTALSFQHFFTAATNGATRPSWWTAIKVK